MATMNLSQIKEKSQRQAQQMSEIFASWKQGQGNQAEAESIFKSVIGATGATFQRMLADKQLMEEVMENELNVVETCLHLMDDAEINQRQERARGIEQQQQALLRSAAGQLSSNAISQDPSFSLMLKVMDQQQMQALVALYGPSFVN